MNIPLPLAISGSLLVGCALLLFLDGGAKDRRLRERVLETREIKATQTDAAEISSGMPSESGFILKITSALGYQAELPPAYAGSPRIIGGVALIIGLIAFNFASRVVPLWGSLLLGFFVAGVVARFLFARKGRAYNGLLFRQIPDAMSLMLRAVRAGLPVAEAIRTVGRECISPTQEEFARVAGETALGVPTEVALRRLSERTKLQEYAFFSVIIGLHGQTGGNLSETLENMADMVRRRVAMAGKCKALSAEGRLSAAVIAALPFVVGLLTLAFNPSYMSEFITNSNGPLLIGVFIVLLSTGLFVTHLMIQRCMEE